MKKFYRINQYIRADKVRAIDSTGKQLGVMDLKAALSAAQKEGLDLVEVASQAKPPVVKIISFTKFKYQEDKKTRSGSKGQQKTKQVRFSPFMAEHDIDIRLNKAKKFLASGDRVKLVVKFSGRQITRKEFGQKILETAISKLSDISTVVEEPKPIGRILIAQIKPTSAKAKKENLDQPKKAKNEKDKK